MGFNRFYVSIILRVILIVIMGVLFAFMIRQEDKIMASIISFVLIVAQTILLINYINKTNRNLAAFFLRIQSKDTAVNYQDEHVMKNFKGLNFSFDYINKELQQIRIENEQKTHYLNTIVNHVKIGIIAFDDKGKIELFNPEASNILHCEACKFMNTLFEKCPDFHQAITDSKTEKTQVVKINLNAEIQNLAIKRTLIQIGSNTIHIISFQNIRRELDHNELESWQKLIQVLNHEIMNSLTPITSLSKVIRRYIHQDGVIKKASELDDEIIKDIAINTEIIEERGRGLVDFIEVYKNVTKNPKLNLTKFKITHTVEKIQKFYQDRFRSEQIEFEYHIDPDLDLFADESLIEQMLINLIKNSLEALVDSPNPKIKITAKKSSEGILMIKIEDNGYGIPESELDKIFIPFYSTKENGSGIGLSLSRQIMYLHKGSISVQSIPKEKTTFTLNF
ncbi:MAG: ATP-binding protein [Bacteroidetes bacterium HGW-Bacteroidetes-17]|jgi:nitrogen fixation/metabolism regulation signal transduction histidine kinase|nr:MAG: ATP-binding protein [Bacteroidetes bacterium HGW-Bacteroidetes-17]